MLVMNKNKTEIRHAINSDSYQEILLSNEEDKISTEIKTIMKDSSKEITMDNESIFIKNYANNYTTKINMSNDGTLRLSSSESIDNSRGKNVESDIIISPAKITVSSGNSKISFDRSINTSNDSITISANNVVLNASKISLGASGYRLVATPNSNMAITLEDGTMLTTIDNITV